MARKILIMGESGTGKTTSLRNCDPATTAIVNPVGKELPFRAKFETLDSITDAKEIIQYMKNQGKKGKKLLVVDDYQYILSIPYMNRIKEAGWDKWNDFGSNYYEIIEACDDLPDDVVVAFMTHCETLENGLTTIKLIGKLLREKITIEGLFTTVLRTNLTDGKYLFLTQNSGSDTVKSPIGMFPTYAIDNDMNYVDQKIRNYYQIGDCKTDEEMDAEDRKVENTELEKGKGGRLKRAKKDDISQEEETTRRSRKTETEANQETAPDEAEATPEPRKRERKKREVKNTSENQEDRP